MGFQFDPSKITCPFLILIGEGEYANKESKKQQQECLETLPNPIKKMVITPINEGASSHCVSENRSLMSQIIFDWLDELFRCFNFIGTRFNHKFYHFEGS